MPLRVALYARYSSDNQREASIQDQFSICRERALKEGWQIVGTYQDARISGASVILRPGIQTLVQDAGAGQFDIVLTEALDRISRDQADIATLYKHLKFLSVPIITLAEGEINELHVGLKGTMNALFLKDLAAKTHRGMKGRAEAGKAASGIAYGYRAVRSIGSDGEPVTGERAIDETQAGVVLRIFSEFVAGKTSTAIARDLNADHIPGPNGEPWQHTTIRGHNERGTGILNNELYIGRQIWNRMRYLKDPSTGRRISRMNPRSEWSISEVPHLRIVPQEIWDQASRRKAEISEKSAPQREGLRGNFGNGMRQHAKPKWLLSGLLICGCCEGPIILVGADRYGCAKRVNSGTCSNDTTIKRQRIEERVLQALSQRMLSPEVAEEAMRGFTAEVNRRNQERRAQGAAWQTELVKVNKAISTIMQAIEDGFYSPDMKGRMNELQAKKSDLQSRLATDAEVPNDILPSLALIYRAKVEALRASLSDPNERDNAAEAIRALIDHIVVTPCDGPDGLTAAIHGDLADILLWVADRGRQTKTPSASASGVCVASGELGKITSLESAMALVAGARFELTTFRL